LIPIQDDPENVKGQGVPRPDANTYAERRIADLGADPGVPQGQRDHRVPRPEPGRIVRLGGTSLGGPGVCHAGKEAARNGSSLHRQGDRLEPTPDHAVDPQVPRRRSGGSGELPAAALPGEIQEAGGGAAGGSGPCAWLAERAGNGAHYAARTPTVRQGRVCASGGNLRGASVQSAGQRGVPQTGGEMGADASQCHQHRGAAQTRAAGTARFPTHRHGAPRRLERGQRGVSHQCGGRGDAMAGSGLRGADQRAISAAGVGGNLASVSLRDCGDSFRQRLGIHQSRGGQNAQAFDHRVDQKPGQSEPGQRAGGRQERGDHSQAHRLRTHRRRTCRSGTQVPHGAPQPILELSSSVWLRDGEPGCARQTAAAIQTGRLCDAIREVEELAGGGEILEGGDELCATGRGGAEDERHRMGAEDDCGQRGTAAALQERIGGPSGNELRGATTTSVCLFSEPRTKKGDRPLRGLLNHGFQDHARLETELSFRIILRLENASGKPWDASVSQRGVRSTFPLENPALDQLYCCELFPGTFRLNSRKIEGETISGFVMSKRHALSSYLDDVAERNRTSQRLWKAAAPMVGTFWFIQEEGQAPAILVASFEFVERGKADGGYIKCAGDPVNDWKSLKRMYGLPGRPLPSGDHWHGNGCWARIREATSR